MSQLTYGKEWITVVNRAMVLLGKEPLDSLEDITDPGANSRIMIALPQAVVYVLGMHPWLGMTRTVVLSPLAGQTTPDGKRLFLLPSDCARVVAGLSSAGFRQVAGGLLESGLDSVRVAYIHAPKTPEDMPPTLLNLTSSYLAYLLAQSLTGSSEMNEVVSTIYQADYEAALRADAAGDTTQDDGAGWWTEAR